MTAAILGRVSLLSKGIALLLEKSGYEIRCDFSLDAHTNTISDKESDKFLFVITDEDRTGDELAALIRDLRYSYFHCFVLVLYSHEVAQDIEHFMDAGADGCLPVSIGPESLVTALNLIVTERMKFVAIDSRMDLHLSSASKTAVLPSVRLPKESRLESGEFSTQAFRIPDSINISDREQAVLQNLIKGDSNKIIARRLSISEATVKIHVRSLLRKIGAENRTQAAIWILNEGYCDAASLFSATKN